MGHWGVRRGLLTGREFGIGGGDEDDIGGGLAEVYGFVVVDGAGLGVQECMVWAVFAGREGMF